MQPLRFIFTLALLLTFFSPGLAQDKSNKGKEFWLGYGYNYGFNNESPVNSQNLVLYLSAEEPANVTVSVNGTSWSQTVSIPANTVNATITVPKSGADDARIFNEGLFDRGIHIVSDTPIVVYAHLYNTMVSGATMLMPVESYGFKYYSLNYAQDKSAFSPPATTATLTQNGPDWYSWFYVVAAEDNTRLQITPSDTTRNGWLPGQTYTVNLNKGQIYNVMGKLTAGNNALWAASKDMTGSKVLSVPGADGNCHPVALFSGSSGIRLCKGDGGEYMQQQVFPTQAWGTRYLTHHTLNNTTTNINDNFKNFYRVAVMDPTTVVKRNGVVLTGLTNNFYYEFLDSLGGDYIESDKPVMVAQYTPGGNRCYMMNTNAYGDPEMFYLSPMEQGKKDVLFYATRNQNIDLNYLNVIVPTAGLSSLLLDGSSFLPANIKPHPNRPGYSVAFARILGPAAQHRLTCDSIFTATMYGLGLFESYGYNVGTFINNLNYYSAIKNVFNSTQQTDTFTCPKTPMRIFLKIGYPATSIRWKLSQVQGITPNADSIISNPIPFGTELINGRTYYVYTLQQDFTFSTPGTYYIPVSYTANLVENCSQTENAQVKVVVKPGPSADFSFIGPTCVKKDVQFTGQPGGNFTFNAFLWTFPDNTTANTVNTVKAFNTAGNNNVRFQVFTPNGCAGDTTKPVAVLPAPLANFGFSGNNCTNSTISFTDSSSTTSGTLTGWQWFFGDGGSINATSNQLQSHSYSTAGSFNVQLVTTGSNGCKSDTATKSITISPKPVAKFGFDRNICLGDSVHFSDSSFISTGNIAAWNWNFGNGNSSIRTNNTPFYITYSNAGSYIVSLVVQAANGCSSDTFKLTVNVNNKPVANFSFTGKPCVDSTLNFTSIAFNPNNPANYYWSYGDGQTFTSNTSNTSTHTYTSAATNIVIKHVVSYGPGCVSDTLSQTIPFIRATPSVQFNIQPAIVCTGRPVQFTGSATGTNLSWQWNFGNGTGSQALPFDRTYTVPGQFTITAHVATAEGCRSLPASQQLTVLAAPQINAGPDLNINKGSSAVLNATIGNPSSYTYNWAPPLYLNDPQILNPVTTPDSSLSYVITATDPLTGCTGIDSMKVNVIYGLYIPNAFTPDRDGKNDKWRIPGLALYPKARVSIFNRWGQLVYSSVNYTAQPWDGTLQGIPQPNHSFVYIIELNNDKKEVLKGTVTIIR